MMRLHSWSAYVNDADKQFYEYDPFATLDVEGVGKLVEMAAKLGRSANGYQVGVSAVNMEETRRHCLL